MPRTLYAKLSLVLVLLLASIGIVYVLLSISTTRHYQQQVDQALNRDLARDLVADRNLVEAGRLNEQALKETFEEYMVINPSIEIYLLDPAGTILSYSADPKKVKRNRVSLEPIHTFLRGNATYPLLGDDPRSHDRHKAFSVTAIPSETDPKGYLYVVLRGQQYDDVEGLIKANYFLKLSGWSVAGSLLFGLLAGLLLFHLMTRRLYRLSTLMDDFRQSGFKHLMPYTAKHKHGDEVDQLGITFNQMALRITEQLDELEEQDNLRRELVANVSHDLRTPLAILHGYLETLKLKATELDDEKRNEYLDAALRNSEQLGRLIGELFELAKLDAHQMAPTFEPFHPAELVQDVLQKFQLEADEKGVALHMGTADNNPFVYADIALIERVLENLITNALQHTPTGGKIGVSLRAHDDAVEVKIADTGCGIEEKDIPHIFERFYRATHEHRNSMHAGLGLAIAKRILELHDGDIQVSSQAGQGATFRFMLPRASSNQLGGGEFVG
ncbi:MAG: HAMP domain-containing histidine kinase [Gammaproteobacteria bacterium]|nr:HAMP domain-containing histidine kinase [Gammaproteobacteria bacterium]MDH3410961.1 HAMP domain-containing histidine kinase [Gammaproteobacteria bacterium]